MSWNWVSKVHELSQQSTPAALVTVSQIKGSSPREVGAKMIVLSDGSFHGTIGGGNLEKHAIDDALKCLKEKTNKSFQYPLGASVGQCCGGMVETLVEVLNTGPHLYVFGAGHVGQAVCRTLIGTPFSLHLIDDREEWVYSENVPKEVIRHCCDWESFVDEAVWDRERTYAAIMTYRHDIDQAIVEDITKRDARYIGLIGSKSKWTRFQDRLRNKGVSEDRFDKVKCPIGMPTGKAPQEVAISFASELLQVHYA